MKKSLFPTILTFVALLTGCAKKQIKINPNKEKYVVGICQFVEHPALDQASNGFKDALTEGLQQNGRQVEFDYQLGAGEAQTCLTVINGFLAKDVDLIMANATTPLQQAYYATDKNPIPVLGTSITDYSSALDIPFKDGKSGTNISGTSDIASIEAQVNSMLSLLSGKNIQKVGILYCSAEANSKFQVDEATKFFNAKGITVNKRSFADTNDLLSVCQACNNDDAVYIPTDNTVASNVETVGAVVTKPIYAGEEGICRGCGFATLTIDYYNLGRLTGDMAVNVLLGKEDITKYAIQYDNNPVAKYSKERCQKLGISVPQGYVEL